MLHIIANNNLSEFIRATSTMQPSDATVILGSTVVNPEIFRYANKTIENCYLVFNHPSETSNAPTTAYPNIKHIHFNQFVDLSAQHARAFTWY